MTEALILLVTGCIEFFDETQDIYTYSDDGLIMINGGFQELDSLDLDLEALTQVDVHTLCREFIRYGYYNWIETDILDIRGLSELNIPKESIPQAFIDYCVYIKVNSLEGIYISYPDFIDTFLGTLEINHENFHSIINHNEFSKYLVSLLQHLEIWNDYVNGSDEFRRNVKSLGTNFHIKDELRFADLILNNIHKFNSELTAEEINIILKNSVEKMNTLSNKEFTLSDLLEKRSHTLIYITVSLTFLFLAALYPQIAGFIVNQ